MYLSEKRQSQTSHSDQTTIKVLNSSHVHIHKLHKRELAKYHHVNKPPESQKK